jgi:hypothetical protein
LSPPSGAPKEGVTLITRFGLSVEKSTLFRGVQQPFANVYYYEAAYNPTDTTQLEAMLDALVTLEKTMHATSVNFKRGRLWNTGSGSQQGNQMRVDKDLTGTGSLGLSSNMDRERCFLIRWPAGFNTRGKQVYLRKWYHSLGDLTGLGAGTPALENTGTLPTGLRTAWENKADAVQDLQVAGIPVGSLVAQTGRTTTGQGECHPYLEHHQLGDQWRT